MGLPSRFEHQNASITKLWKLPRGLDYSDAGTGKTRTQIDLFYARRLTGGGCALILAPKMLLESAWKEDFNKFAPDLKVSVAYAKNRAAAFTAEADVYVTNVDATRWLAKQPPKFFKRFEVLIIDEISAFKHRTSLRSRSLRKIIKHFIFRYGLTGTPNANHILDVWHQAFVIDDGVRLGRTFSAYRASVAFPVQVGPQANMVKWEEKPGSSAAVSDLLSDITLRYELEQCHDMPKNHMYPVHYNLPFAHRKAYDELERHAVLLTKNNEVVNAVNAAALVTKLLQVASGSVYDEDSNVVEVDTARYELIADLADARPHTLIFFNWRHQVEALQAALKQRGLTSCVLDGSTSVQDRARYVSEFQEGLYRVCLAHPQSAAHGLTLTRATTAIWASPTYNLEHFLQGNRRIYRAGQTKRTETILVTAKGTLEEKVYTKLKDKDERQLDFLKFISALS